MTQGRFLKIVSAFLAMIMCLSFSACGIFDILQAQIDSNSTKSNVSVQELNRLLVNAVNHPENIANCFSAIPENQRKNLSYSYFTEYVDIIREMTKNHGTISSFRILNSTDSQAVFDEITADTVDGNTVVHDFGKVIVSKLCFAHDSDLASPVYVYFCQEDNGTCTFSSSWINQVVSIHNYIEHYFDMLDSQNIEGISTLLEPSLTDDIYTDQVVRARAECISNYYLLKVRNSSTSFKLLSVNPYEIIYNEPEVIDEDNATVISRIVSVVKQSDSSFSIIDMIPEEGDTNLINVYRHGARILRCGNDYDYDEISDIFGEPIGISVGTEILDTRLDDYGSVENQYRILVNYNGILLVFNAYYDRDDKWEGTLITSRFFGSNDFYIANDVYVGMSVSELLEHYPMLDEYNYEISYLEDDETYIVDFTISNGILSDIRIALL